MNSLTSSSIQYLENTSLQYRKKMGQYFTPASITDIIFKHITLPDNSVVFDPAVGSGELLCAAYKHNPNINLIGFDVDNNVLKIAKHNNPSATIVKHSVYDKPPTELLNTVDYIIMNPPYFQIPKNFPNNKDFTIMNGRVNIFGLFFERYTSLLKEGGHLIAIVPPSMNNGAYFVKLREYILNNYVIDNLIVLRNSEMFIDANQSIQIMFLTKTSTPQPFNKNPYVVDFKTLTHNPDTPTVFTDNKKLITTMWKNKTNLHSLGYTVTTGTIEWNKYKTILESKKSSNNYPLYYSKDIIGNNLVVNKKLQHKRFLKNVKPVYNTSSILVNRVIGSISNPVLKCAYVKKHKYYVENHVNVILPTSETKITMETVFNRLVSTDYKKYLQALTGNTQLSAKELLYLIPL